MKTLALCLFLVLGTLRLPAPMVYNATDSKIQSTFNLYEAMPFSFSMWVNIAGNHESGYGLLMERRTAGGSGWAVYLMDNNSVNMEVTYTVGSMSRSTPASAIVRGKWVNVVFSHDGSGVANGTHVYLDGIEVTYSSSINAGSAIQTSPGSIPITVGNRENSTLTFNGQICEAAYWTNALSQADADVLKQPVMGRPLMVRPRSLRWYYPMGHGASGSAVLGTAAAVDATGHSEHGTVFGTTVYSGSAFSFP